jgi:hypothetical protein
LIDISDDLISSDEYETDDFSDDDLSYCPGDIIDLDDDILIAVYGSEYEFENSSEEEEEEEESRYHLRSRTIYL